MKKTLAAVLCAVLVLSCCCAIFASADTATNLAKGLKVPGLEACTREGLEAAGFESQWKWPSEYCGDLTDGVVGEAVTLDENWLGLYYSAAVSAGCNVNDDMVASGVVDLGAVCAVEKVRLHAFVGNNSGITAPESVSVEVSTDGKTFTSYAAAKTYEKPAESDYTAVEWIEFANAVSARYVRVNVKLQSVYAFLDELEVIGTKGAAPVESSQDTSSDTSSEPTVVTKTETVTVDGKLDDDAWTRLADSKWFSKYIWQNTAETEPRPALDAAYAIRSDADNIYVAVKISDAWNYVDDTFQTGATDIRIWMLGDKDYAEGTKRVFFDVALNAEGGLSLWLNKEPVANGEIVAAADTKADTIVAEFAIKKSAVNAENGVKMMVTYASPLVAEEGKESKYNALHLSTMDYTEAGGCPQYWVDASTYAEYKFADTALVEYTVSDEPAPVDPVAEYTAAIAEKLGAAVADSAMNVTLSNVVAEDGTITVTLTIDGLKDGAQVDVLEGALYYDAEKLTLTTNLEDLVLTTSPDSDWETLTAPAGEGKLDFSAFTTKAKTLLNKDGKLTMDLTFTLKDGCTYGAVWMENGVSGEETDLETGAAKNTYKANGGYTVINTTPVVEPSEDSSSATSSTTPKPGDAGIVVFALLGLVAVAGAAVVIKVRH